MMAWVAATVGFQPEMVPSSVAKMTRLGPDAPPSLTTKSLVGLKALPVGAPPGPPPGRGMVTTGGTPMPLPLYRVARPVPLSDTSQGPVGLWDRPHALTGLESWNLATPGRSETRFRCTYDPPL